LLVFAPLPAFAGDSDGTVSLDEILEEQSNLDAAQLACLAKKESAQSTSAEAKLDADLKTGTYLLLAGQLSGAKALATDCLKRATELKDKQRVPRALLLLGRVLRSKGREERAQRYFREALEKIEASGNTEELANALNHVAVGYVSSGSAEMAVPLFQRALSLAQQRGNGLQELGTINNLANIYRQHGENEKALELFADALHRAELSGQFRVQAALHRNMGALLLSQRKLPECLSHLQSSITLSRQHGNKRQLVSALIVLSRALILVNDNPGAMTALGEAENLISSLDNPLDLLVRFYDAKGLVLENAGKFEEALKAQRRMHAYYGTAQSRLQTSDLRELNIRYEVKRRTRELEDLRSQQTIEAMEQKAAQDRVSLLSIGLCGSLAFGALSIVLFRAKLRAERSELAMIMDARCAAESTAGLKTRLLRMAAHDLRSPLTVIISGGDLIKLFQGEPEKVTQYANMTIEAANYMNSLLESLLTQAATDDGVLSIRPVPTDMREHVSEIVAYFQSATQRKGQNLQIIAEKGVGYKAMADPIRIWQVLENLISNASKFSPADSIITIRLAARDDMIICGVTDQGPGISETEIAQLFKPFARGKAKPTAGERSTGLGLSMAKEIIELHKGRIWIESALGKGSTFWISLPMALLEH
jgi:signal transduction histidine kinase/Tfp pilus assembly protein PilF